MNTSEPIPIVQDVQPMIKHDDTTKKDQVAKNTERQIPRSLLLIITCFNTVVTSGAIFGWASFQQILLDRGVYIDYCPEELKAAGPGVDFSEVTCTARSDALAWIFTLGTFAGFANGLPVGIFMDWAGAKITGALMAALFMTGQIIIMIYPIHGEVLIVIGYFLMGLAGPCVQMSSLLVSELFPSKKGTVLSIFTSLFDLAAFMFVIFYTLSNELGFSWNSLWLIWIGVLGFVFLNMIFCYPKRWQNLVKDPLLEDGPATTPQNFHLIKSSQDSTCISTPQNSKTLQKDLSISTMADSRGVSEYLDNTNITHTQAPKEIIPSTKHSLNVGLRNLAEDTLIHQREAPKMEEEKFLRQVCSRRWFFRTFFVAISILFSSFYILSLREQLKKKKFNDILNLSSEENEWVENQITIFSYIVPLGFIGLPLLGYILDYRPPWTGYVWVNILNSAIALCFLFLDNPVAQIVGFFGIAMSRQASYGVIMNGFSRSYGPKNFGKHIGLTNICVALIGLLQQPLYSYCLNKLDGDFTIINIVFLILMAIQPLYHIFFEQEPSKDNSNILEKNIKKNIEIVDYEQIGYSTLSPPLSPSFVLPGIQESVIQNDKESIQTRNTSAPRSQQEDIIPMVN